MFIPFCPGGAQAPPQMPAALPAAVQVPYPCSQCQAHRDGRSGDSFRQVLAQAGVSALSDAVLKSPHRKTRTRKLQALSDKGEEKVFFVPRAE